MKSRQFVILGAALSTLGLGVAVTMTTSASKLVGVAAALYGVFLIAVGLAEGASRLLGRKR